MNVHVSYKVPKSSDLEQSINQHIEKLRKRLQFFKPDLVHLHGTIEEGPARVGFTLRLDLRLPSGNLATHKSAKRAEEAIKAAFDDLIELVAKHKARLRAEYRWPKRREGNARSLAEVPFEETVAAVRPEPASQYDIASYLNANLPKLQRFVERELRYRENTGELRVYQLASQEVVGEAVANALGQEERPEKLGLEPWLYRLALNAIRDLSRRSNDEVESVHLEDPAHDSASRLSDGSDEPILQFHQPDESLTSENLIPDQSTANPEESAASDEMVGMIETALRGSTKQDREAFLLFGIEGFTVDEISAISSRSTDDVRQSIKSAREHLRNSLPVPSAFKDKLLQQAKIA